MIVLDINGWLMLKWRYQPTTPNHYKALFKGYINACYAHMHEQMLKSTNLTPEK